MRGKRDRMVNGQGKMMGERRWERKGKREWTIWRGKLERPRTEGHERY